MTEEKTVKDLVVFLDMVGRTIIAKKVEETDSTLKVENPAVVNIVPQHVMDPNTGKPAVDPNTGQRYLDPNALSGLFGGMGVGTGAGAYDPYRMTGYGGGQVTAPDPYGGGDWERPEELSAAEVIESYRPTMEQNIAEGFAEAGNRLGQSGFGMSTSYAKALGDVERLARAQMNQRALEFGYDATKFDRDQELARQMAENAERFGAWQTHGGWGLGAQQFNVGNEMQRWALANQLGMQGNIAQNQYNLQNQQLKNQESQYQQQILASLLGGLF